MVSRCTHLVAMASPAAWLCQGLLLLKWLSSLLHDGLDSLLEFNVVGDTTPLDDFTKEFCSYEYFIFCILFLMYTKLINDNRTIISFVMIFFFNWLNTNSAYFIKKVRFLPGLVFFISLWLFHSTYKTNMPS